MQNAVESNNNMQLVRVMQVLGDPTRFKMFQIMLEDEKLCVSDIAHRLNISIPAVSQHFRTFELVGLVGKQRQGQKVCYELRTNSPLVDKISTLVQEENNGTA